MRIMEKRMETTIMGYIGFKGSGLVLKAYNEKSEENGISLIC